jgi:hypothetical protein
MRMIPACDCRVLDWLAITKELVSIVQLLIPWHPTNYLSTRIMTLNSLSNSYVYTDLDMHCVLRNVVRVDWLL